MEARITGITAPSVYSNNTRHVPFLPGVSLFPCHSHNSASSSFGISVHKKRKQKCILNVRAQSSTDTPPPPPGDSNSKAVLDAFFIGKAFAEALNERIEMAIGEFLSEIGKLQAEQLKQTRDFQVPLTNFIQTEEVLERAKIAKEKAAREAMAKEPAKDMSTSSSISSTSTAKATDSSAASDKYSPSTDPSSTPNNSGPLPLDSN